ncbi:putative disease resistance protein At1g58400 [Telopea speciosissima]|uniref:putative disease resistance protein At1g58400 n=1 Tax=Telopea speciosissima TaxID=54955 RepID=UPI001CC7DC84|nr:putative disease resistance protein At1g58400 [Telopea speciosissima]
MEKFSDINDALEEKNYLIVFDDMWRDEDWAKLQLYLPVKQNQECKVLVTTRNDDVSKKLQRIAPPHKVKLLDEVKSLDLFLKVVCQSSDGMEASLNKGQMKVLTKKIVSKCGGLTQAIADLGYFLSKEETTCHGWSNPVG